MLSIQAPIDLPKETRAIGEFPVFISLCTHTECLLLFDVFYQPDVITKYSQIQTLPNIRNFRFVSENDMCYSCEALWGALSEHIKIPPVDYAVMVGSFRPYKNDQIKPLTRFREGTYSKLIKVPLIPF